MTIRRRRGFSENSSLGFCLLQKIICCLDACRSGQKVESKTGLHRLAMSKVKGFRKAVRRLCGFKRP